ncbi:ROK family transcriptional regulator [Actinomadura alba]|uniref:ROK family transcriptional regulator n=1 Tax=Actinomadura alba TaxID=406431 RepID=A0ABR7LXE9_9ACTN|nr:ROK family transcriptional regulator [Actinomadura alba]MBC6469449.1 ROK family transcriptional regulator [Actinomadura alba]
MAPPTPGTPSLLRAINDRAALEMLLAHGALTRPRLGELTGLSKPTASQLLARLEQAGLVVQDGIKGGSTGRTAEMYRIDPSAAHVAGLDVTPVRIRVAVADLLGTVVGEHTLRTPGRSGEDVVGRVRAAVDSAARAGGLELDRLNRVVIGIQGAVDPSTGRLGYAAHIPGWHVPDVTGRMAEGLGLRVAIENDVNLAALAELDHGQAAGIRDFVLLWVGNGIGMAAVLGGRLHRGATGGAGEIGYMPLAGAPLVRGVRRAHTGGMQLAAGAPAVLKLMRGHGFRGTDAVKTVERAAASIERASIERAAGGALDGGVPDGRTLDGGALAAGLPEKAADEAARAAAALAELAARLGIALANVTAVLDPELIILSGGVLHAGGEPLRALIERELHALTIPRPRLRLSSVEGNPVLAGALHLALAQARDEVFSSTFR